MLVGSVSPSPSLHNGLTQDTTVIDCSPELFPEQPPQCCQALSQFGYTQAPFNFDYEVKQEASRRLRVLSKLHHLRPEIKEQIDVYMILSLLHTDISSDNLQLIRHAIADL
ncbi:hypothetical protein FRC06_009683 [Ceratobasidium sp. 370]|nr:hypothetical protein FRC06_009683 [Ceratobasidium sp. 370]